MTEPTDEDLLETFQAACDHGDRCNQGHSYARAQALRAVLAKWGTPPAVARTETIELRRMLCAAHAGHLAYMDDGEAQDNREFPLIDFLRDSPPEIQDKLHRRALKKFSTAQPTQAQAGAVPLTDAQSHALIERMANEAEQWAEGLSYEPTQEQLSGWCVAFIQREIHFAHGIKGGQHDI